MSEKDFRELMVKDVYENFVGKPAVVNEDAMLKDAVDAMTLNLTSRKVYVVDGQGKLMGMVSIEILLRQVGYKVGVREAGVIPFFKFITGILKEDVTRFMEKKPVKVTNRHKLIDAMRLMAEFHLNDLPVVDEDGTIIGELNGLSILEEAKKIFEK